MCRQYRSDTAATYEKARGKSCPTEILAALSELGAEGRPIWKPMHCQPLYRSYPFVTAKADAPSVGEDVFARGLCLPSDIKMTEGEQAVLIARIRRCFL
jgi:dTDP-4-amino-4,6-dideoxygalactose transaminase